MGDDDRVTEKDTNSDPSSSVKLDEVGISSSSVAADGHDKTLVLDNERGRQKIVKPRLRSQILFHSTNQNDGGSRLMIMKFPDN